jgi:acetolactate synthase-1/3 small subunit
MEAKMRKHILSVLVQNRPGVLAHISGMFAARGYNIDSLVVGRTEDPDFSRMVIVSTGDDDTMEQVRKQLGKIIEVVKLRDLSEQACVERDLLLIQVHCPPDKRTELRGITEVFRGSIVDVGSRSIVIQLTGPEDKIEAFVELCRPYGIKALSRTGVIAVPRSSQANAPTSATAKRTGRVRGSQASESESSSPAVALPPS